MTAPIPMTPDTFTGLPALALRGRFYRIVHHDRREEVLSTEGSRHYGGRYNPPAAFGALYLSEHPAVAAAEVRRAAADRRLGPFVLATVEVGLVRLLDLTDHAVRTRLGIRPDDLVAADYTLPRRLGSLAREAGFEGLLVPSATGLGTNLVLFPDRLDPTSSLRLLTVEPAGL